MPSPWPDLTVSYAHRWTEIRKGIDSQGPYYKVTYYIEQPWSVGDQVVNELLGYATKTGGSPYWQGPHQYPLDPTGRSVCFQADIVGVGNMIRNSDGYPEFDTGFFVEALYRVPLIPMYSENDPNNTQGIDPATPLLWATQDFDFSTDFILLDRSQYTFTSDSSKSTVPVRIKTGITIMDITFHRVPFMPSALIRAARGCVNSSTFMGSSAGQILFKGARTHKEINPDGSYIRTVQLIFHERNQSWNKVFRPDTLAWDGLVDGSGNGPYLTSNLNNLLALGQSYTAGS